VLPARSMRRVVYEWAGGAGCASVAGGKPQPPARAIKPMRCRYFVNVVICVPAPRAPASPLPVNVPVNV
jgi:hypothetical protein